MVDAITVETMKLRIEQMTKTQHIEVLKLLHSFSAVKLNENKSGVYVNLSFLPRETIDQLKEYVAYTNDQENTLHTMETQQNEFKNTFFNDKDNKDEMPLYYSSTA
jgi:spore coat protein CotH